MEKYLLRPQSRIVGSPERLWSIVECQTGRTVHRDLNDFDAEEKIAQMNNETEKETKQYLVGFTHIHFGQGDHERVPETALVYAENFEDACRKIRQSMRWDNPTCFEDRTVF